MLERHFNPSEESETLVRAQTAEFGRLLRDFERFYALTAREGGNDWAIYETPSKLSNTLAPSKEHAAAESLS